MENLLSEFRNKTRKTEKDLWNTQIIDKFTKEKGKVFEWITKEQIDLYRQTDYLIELMGKK